MTKHLTLLAATLLGAAVFAAPAHASAALRPFEVTGNMQVVPGTQQQHVAWWCGIAAPGATRISLTCSLSASGTEQATADFENAIYPVEFHSKVVNTPIEPVTFCYSGVAYYSDGTSKSAHGCVTH